MTLSVTDTLGDLLTTAQTPGSDTTSISGSLTADLTSNTLQLLGGGVTDFATQPDLQQPLHGGAPGSAAAQFGLSASIPGLVTGVAAGRNFTANATSPMLPVVGGAFDASQVVLNLLTGSIDYNLNVLGQNFANTASVVGYGHNMLTGGTLSVVGDVATLTVPFLETGSFAFNGVQVVPTFAGQIVATATVPESGSLVSALVGLIGLSTICIRRRINANCGGSSSTIS